MDTKEVWRRIIDFEDYEVSNCGRVRSWKYTNSPKILKQFLIGRGYPAVILSNKNKAGQSQQKQKYVHRLVGKAFIDNPDKKLYINHIDESKDNNNAENLEWRTQRENIQIHFALAHNDNCSVCREYNEHIKIMKKYGKRTQVEM